MSHEMGDINLINHLTSKRNNLDLKINLREI